MVKDYNVKAKVPEITNQEESNRKEKLAAIGTLTCALAHELRNIFVVIKGAAHMQLGQEQLLSLACL